MNVLFASYTDFFLLLSGKLVVLAIQIIWVISIFNFVPNLNGYSREQLLVYFTMAYCIDRFVRFLFYRGFFFAPSYVHNGIYDKMLTLPANSIFITAFRVTDWNDFFSIIPAFFLMVFTFFKTSASISLLTFFSTAFFIFLGILTAFSILLIIASLAFIFIKIDNLYLIYRDLMNLTQFPPEIYGSVVSIILSTLLPFFIIIATPAKSLLGILGPSWMLLSVLISLSFFIGSIKFWDFCVKQYTSASS